MTEPTSQELVEQFAAGDGDAADAIFDRYVERLVALARTRIGGKLRRRLDPEDVVQSAYRSFFLHARKGEYWVEHTGGLWRLLARVTLNKLYGQIEKQTAAKRSIHQEAANATHLAEIATRDPSIAEMVAATEQLTRIMRGLTEDERGVLTLTLQGQGPAEIAAGMGKSERTVRRWLAEARKQFERQLLASAERRQATAAVAMPTPAAPLRFGDFVFEQLLGAGGMGKVYRATDQRSGRKVAIKSLHKTRQDDARTVTQFVQEAQILTQLRHPNLVGVEGLGRFPAGGYFMVMELIEGTDLQSVLESGPLTVSEAIAIVSAISRGVEHAHQHGIIHCDLKPANVLMGNEGRIAVADFGFACILSHGVTASAHPVGGTMGYVAPEVLAMQDPATPAADVFALGALLWTLVDGKVPSGREEVCASSEDLQSIVAICRRCLDERPASRFATMGEMRAALDALQDEWRVG
ncbi:MAG TPA: hypothetical protein DCY79_13780 [Planctomycetaceae bacterium]|nr:hypothetical protein [Blastopirellula sp.]HAY80872.1 hypothetical protein [Planctomycetaceae bacterium]